MRQTPKSSAFLLCAFSFCSLISTSNAFTLSAPSLSTSLPLQHSPIKSSSSSSSSTWTTATIPHQNQLNIDSIRAKSVPLSTTRRNSKLFTAAAAEPPSSSTSIEKQNATKKRLITGLAFLTGWSDVALIFKHKSFATMMTGNTMWMASAAIESRYKDVLYYLSLIFSYSLGVAAFRRADVSLKERSLKVCSPAVALLFVASDVLGYLNPGSRWMPMVLLSAAFGMVNSVGIEVGGTLAFVLTGHLTKITNLIFDRISRTAGRKKLTEKDWEAARQSVCVIAAFFGGALWACGVFEKFPMYLKRGAFGTIGVLYGLLFVWQDRKTLGTAWWTKEEPRMCDIDNMDTTCE